MSEDEIPLDITWVKAGGGNPGLHDERCFYQADPQGFFVGKLDGKIIAQGSAVIYDHNFAFCGFYMVEPAYTNARHCGKNLSANGYDLALM